MRGEEKRRNLKSDVSFLSFNVLFFLFSNFLLSFLNCAGRWGVEKDNGGRTPFFFLYILYIINRQPLFAWRNFDVFECLVSFFFLLDETPKNEEKIIERHIKETNKKSISIVVLNLLDTN